MVKLLWEGKESCQVREEVRALSQSEGVVGDCSTVCNVGAEDGAATNAIVKDTLPSGVGVGGSGVGW